MSIFTHASLCLGHSAQLYRRVKRLFTRLFRLFTRLFHIQQTCVKETCKQTYMYDMYMFVKETCKESLYTSLSHTTDLYVRKETYQCSCVERDLLMWLYSMTMELSVENFYNIYIDIYRYVEIYRYFHHCGISQHCNVSCAWCPLPFLSCIQIYINIYIHLYILPGPSGWTGCGAEETEWWRHAEVICNMP